MGLISGNTRWIFVLPSVDKTEERFIQDIAFGVRCLLKKGIDYSNITIFIDNNLKNVTEYCFSYFGVPAPDVVYETNQIEEVMKTNTYKYAVVFVTGHGSSEGMASSVAIKPFPFYMAFQKAPKLKKTVFYLGQCYAGIFNYMPLTQHLNIDGKHLNNMVAIGATGLYPSISSTTQLNANCSWDANIFLLNVFKWISLLVDVDGDSKVTVMDSFKYASVESNKYFTKRKKENTFSSIIEIEQVVTELKQRPIGTLSDQERLSLEIETEAIDTKLLVNSFDQDSWILNAAVAMNTEY